MAACTSVVVRPVRSPPPVSFVCIKENPRVIVHDFLDVVREGLARHGIRSKVFAGDPSPDCEVLLTYTALQSWDLALYLSHAEVRLERDGAQIGYAEFHLRGKGGFSFFKWQGTRTKMDPVLDELLSQLEP